MQSAEVPVSETACIFHSERSLHEIQPQALEINKRIQYCLATAPLNRLKNQNPSGFRYHTFGFLHSGSSSAEYSPMKILDHTGGKKSLEKSCGIFLRQLKVLVPDLLPSHKSSSQKRQNSAADASSYSFLVSHIPSDNMGFLAQFLTWRKEWRKVI